MEFEYPENLDLQQLVMRTTLQLIVSKPDNPLSVTRFGSGFLLHYRNKVWFVTADHVVHPDDHDPEKGVCQRTSPHYLPQIITNMKGDGTFTSINITVPSIYYTTSYKFDEETLADTKRFFEIFDDIVAQKVDSSDDSLPLGVAIPDFPDIAVSEIAGPLVNTIVCNCVIGHDGEEIVAAGEKKLILQAACIADFNVNDAYIVGGTIKNRLENGINLIRENVLHYDMRYERNNNIGTAILTTPEEPALEYWSGLSGAPVFNHDGRLVGVLSHGPDVEPYVEVYPAKKLLNFIDTLIVQSEISSKNESTDSSKL